MTANSSLCRDALLPDWVPDAVRHYLAHTEGGHAIRELARARDVHASTILRQVRRTETRRDDPLVDDALRALSGSYHSDLATPNRGASGMSADPKTAEVALACLSDETIEMHGERVLRRLVETGAVLAVARDMEMGVVVRDGVDGTPQRTAVVERDVAQALALRDWISSADLAARVVRYRITATGRAALRRMLAVAENRARAARGFSDVSASFEGSSVSELAQRDEPDSLLRHARSSLAESPLAGLARRRDRDGQPFLERGLVRAGEQLREDFEIAQIARGSSLDWEEILLRGVLPGSSDGKDDRSTEARVRVERVLAELGPGLADVVLRCCCLLEGMEQLEKRMGWSARSGKIVLRIALQRLQRHYAETQGKFAPKIG